MYDRYESILNIEFSTELPKSLIVELSAIFNDDDIEEFELIDEKFLEKVLNFALDNVYQDLCFHPFDKVVNSDDEKLQLTYCWEKWIKYVHCPLHKGIKRRKLSQLPGKLPLDIDVALALIAILNKFHGIFSHGRPVVTLP